MLFFIFPFSYDPLYFYLFIAVRLGILNFNSPPPRPPNAFCKAFARVGANVLLKKKRRSHVTEKWSRERPPNTKTLSRPVYKVHFSDRSFGPGVKEVSWSSRLCRLHLLDHERITSLSESPFLLSQNGTGDTGDISSVRLLQRLDESVVVFLPGPRKLPSIE